MDQALAKNIRQSILRASHRSGHGHIPTCFSIVESLIATYRFMDHDPQTPAAPHGPLRPFAIPRGFPRPPAARPDEQEPTTHNNKTAAAQTHCGSPTDAPLPQD